jgi:hypothetical protein
MKLKDLYFLVQQIVFLELFNPDQDPNLVIIDFAKSRVIDQSALKQLKMLLINIIVLEKKLN